MNGDGQPKPRLRLLVVIASFGLKNLGLLKRVIARYQEMSFDVCVVVVSDGPKDLGPGVEVVVGLPTKDPWSLPFAHKPILAGRVEDYDLFAYSEDDMEVTEDNIQAFLRATPRLAPDEIAGFLRYEVDKSGVRSLPDVHSYFRWKPESVQRRGTLLLAEYSCEHAAFYVLTRDQLRKAIASGGFLQAPNRGRFDMACTAATDPYTNCGFRKVVCVSELDSFLIHHASNRYAGEVGPTLIAFQEQVQALEEIADGVRVAKTLCDVESKVLRDFWGKSLYEKCDPDCLEAVPEEAQSVLSIGCGSGAFESELRKRGANVTALALDSVIGAVAEARGINVIYGSLEEGLTALESQQFDCVAISHLLHLLEEPSNLLESCSRMVRPGGWLLLSGANFNRFPVLLKRAFPNGNYRKLRAFSESGINLCGPSEIAAILNRSGFEDPKVRWLNHSPLLGAGRGPKMQLGWLTANDWMVVAERVESGMSNQTSAEGRIAAAHANS